MEALIRQAFVHVEVVGPHVQMGHYDLIGPNGEIILPSVWQMVIQPDWAISMHMWPVDKAPLRGMRTMGLRPSAPRPPRPPPPPGWPGPRDIPSGPPPPPHPGWPRSQRVLPVLLLYHPRIGTTEFKIAT